MLRALLGVLGAIALVAVAMYITGNYELADRLFGVFLSLQDRLPLTLDFDQFLVLLSVLSLIIVGLVVSSAAIFLTVASVRLSVARQRHGGQASAAKREVLHIQEEQHKQYERLLSLAQLLTKRLDKRIIVQSVTEAASRVTSVPQANSAVSCWLLNFETDTFRFEHGLYSDEAFFTKSEYQPTDLPFSRVLTIQKPWVITEWKEQLSCIKPEKAGALGVLSAAVIVPLVIEGSVLAVLIIFCHPDVAKSYEQERLSYETVWGELGLGLAIAIQGAVAILDRLTGVHNREYFMKRLIQEHERATRFKVPMSLLMIDIDNFKQVNDMLGHPQGDAVLKIISKLIKKEIRAIDLAGRYGGEEFIVMLPETGLATDPGAISGALVVAERIRKAVYDEFYGLQKPLNLSISVGVAVRRIPEDRDMDYRDLIRIADEQLYKAKTTGKNKVCVALPDASKAAS